VSTARLGGEILQHAVFADAVLLAQLRQATRVGFQRTLAASGM